jgi:multisubunit Na+/H+ antiporter MnhB subunit
MTAVVRAERAKATWLTGAAGLLILGTALAMMLAAAPTQAHPRAQGAVVRTVAYFYPGGTLNESRVSVGTPRR